MSNAEWATAHLGDVASINMGQSPPSSTVNEDGYGLPFIQGNAEFGPRNPQPVKFCLRPQKEAQAGDILLSVRAPVGALNLAERPLCIGRGLSAITATGVDAAFLWHALRRGVSDLARVSQGSTFVAINKADLCRLEIALPSLAEQRKIAAILSSVDDAIEKTLAVIDQVQVVKRGLMQELLTRGLPGRHTRFKQTEIGEMPAEWRTSCIGDIARCDYGTSDALQHSGQGIPILRMGNLRDGRVSLDDVKYLAGDRVSESLLLFRGDVLFNRTNSADLVGKVAAFDHQARVSFASYLLRLRVKPNVGTGFWLSYLLNTGTLQKRLRAAATVGVSQVNINRKSLLATVIPVPPVEEQSAMVSILDSVCRKVEAEQDVAAQLAQVKSALMSVLLTGELRVTPDS